MSQENVEIIRRSLEGWNRGDWDAALVDMAPGFELDLSRAAGPDSGVYDTDQTRRLWDEFTELWDSATIEIEDVIDAGDEVVTPVTFRIRGREGIEVPARPAWVWTIRDGAVSRVVMYQELDDALEAVGLRE